MTSSATPHPHRLSVGDPATRKTRLLARPCDTCIFRPGNPMHLSPGRLRELITETVAAESYIICHDTLPHQQAVPPAICRGFHDHYDTLSLRLIRALFGFTAVEPPPTGG
jgi:hypothetical protein